MSAQHSLPHEMREYLRTEGAAGEGVPSGRTPRQELHPLQQAAPAQVLPHCVRKSDGSVRSQNQEVAWPSEETVQ
jgi:hypothetical protein